MDTNKINTFLVVAREKSLTKAADLLYITPAAVKKQIDALEDEVHVKLFNRTSSGCMLTDAGEVFKEGAEQIKVMMQNTIIETQQAEKQRYTECKVGYSVRLNYYFLTDLISSFSSSHPNNHLHFNRMKKSELILNLTKGLIDCFFYINPDINDFPDLQYTILGTTTIHAVVQKHHPLAEKNIINIEDLKPYHVYVSSVIGNALKNDMKAVNGSLMTIIENTDRDHIISDLQRNSVILYPCATDHDVSIPFVYRPLMIALYYKNSNPIIEYLAKLTKSQLQINPRIM